MSLRHARACLCALLVACVPAAEDPPPRGALGANLVPSDATRGVPFVTGDGYEVTVERTALYLSINVQTIPRVKGSDLDGFESFGGESVFADLRYPTSLLVRALNLGRRNGYMRTERFDSYIFSGAISRQGLDRTIKRSHTEDIDILGLGVGIDTLRREPMGLVRIRATRGGEEWRMDLVLAPDQPVPAGTLLDGEVKKDELTALEVPVHVENIFRFVDDDLVPRGVPMFGPYVAADSNRDRLIEAQELSAFVPTSDSMPACARPDSEKDCGPPGRLVLAPRNASQLLGYRLTALFQE